MRLYKVLKPHLPKYKEGEEALEYFSKITKNIRTSGRHRDYVEAVSIMVGMPVKDIIQFESMEILQTFINGLTENRIISLVEFAQQVGYDG